MTAKQKLIYGHQDHSFQAAGELSGVKKLVNDFYDYMEHEKFASSIRAMHPADLAVTRDKLTLFLTAWLGGPKLLQQKYGSINIPRVHMPFPIDDSHKKIWLKCMKMAIDDQNYEPTFAAYLLTQLKVPANRITTVCAYHFEEK